MEKEGGQRWGLRNKINESIATKKLTRKNPIHLLHLRGWVGQLIIISKVQYVTSMTLNMRFNIPICILIPMNYNFLLLYHVNSFLQLNFYSKNIYFCRCFPAINTSLHLLLNIFTWSQCKCIFNTSLHLLFNIHTQSQCMRILNISLHLLSNHPNFCIFIHHTSNTICRFS